MTNWRHTLKIKHLFTDKSDHESIQESMNKVAKEIERNPFMQYFSVKRFKNIPLGNDVFSAEDYANRLLDRLYDFANANLIWIE